MFARIALSTLGLLLAVSAAEGPPTKLVPPASPHAAANVRYVDATAESGVAAFRDVSGSPAKNYVVEVTGSGVGTFDVDGDGLPDVYLVNGSTLDIARGGTAAPRAALFRNLDHGRFEDITERAGVGNGRWGQGVCAGDFDNDGREDFYVTNFGVNRLYKNNGARFTDVAPAAGVAVDSWSTGCAFGDYDGDGWLDLYVAGYVALDLNHLPPSPSGSSTAAPPDTATGTGPGQVGMGAAYTPGSRFCTYRGERVMCGPRGLPGAPDHLFHNNHDGTFTDVTDQAGVTDRKRLYGFGVAWFDVDDDGKLDLIVANDSGPNYVYRNAGNGKFEDVSYPSGAALDGNGRDQAHMGIAIGDYDNDGRDDVHITNFADDFNVLYHNLGGGSFMDVSFRAGIARASIPFLGWGTDFLDYDNDGWLDLLVVNGHVYPQVDRMEWNTSYEQRALLFRNLDGQRFEDVGEAAGPGLTTPRCARGSAVADLDNDGGVDIVENIIDGPPALLRSEGTGRGHWLTISLKGDPARRCPRDAIGSVVFVTAGGRRVRGEVASGRGQLSQSDLRVHVGLGAATKADAIEVRWANGEMVRYSTPAIDTSIAIDQATGSVSVTR
jgi:hypothetical protein